MDTNRINQHRKNLPFSSSGLARRRGTMWTLALAVLLCGVTWAALATGDPTPLPATASEPDEPIPTASPGPSPPALPNVESPCAVGGCSGEVCRSNGTDSELVSTCMWRPEYACYLPTVAGFDSGTNTTLSSLERPDARHALALCTRGTVDECGWQMTPELSACVAYFNSSGLQSPTDGTGPSSPPPLPTSDPFDPSDPKSNFTCVRWGCTMDLCVAEYPDRPLETIVCAPQETESSRPWAKCFKDTDCQRVITGAWTNGNPGSGPLPDTMSSGDSVFLTATAPPVRLAFRQDAL